MFFPPHFTPTVPTQYNRSCSFFSSSGHAPTPPQCVIDESSKVSRKKKKVTLLFHVDRKATTRITFKPAQKWHTRASNTYPFSQFTLHFHKHQLTFWLATNHWHKSLAELVRIQSSNSGSFPLRKSSHGGRRRRCQLVSFFFRGGCD